MLVKSLLVQSVLISLAAGQRTRTSSIIELPTLVEDTTETLSEVTSTFTRIPIIPTNILSITSLTRTASLTSSTLLSTRTSTISITRQTGTATLNSGAFSTNFDASETSTSKATTANSSSSDGGMPPGARVGIIVGGVLGGIFVLGILSFIYNKRQEAQKQQETIDFTSQHSRKGSQDRLYPQMMAEQDKQYSNYDMWRNNSRSNSVDIPSQPQMENQPQMPAMAADRRPSQVSESYSYGQQPYYDNQQQGYYNYQGYETQEYGQQYDPSYYQGYYPSYAYTNGEQPQHRPAN
jgi:hypothetical protein